MNLVVNGLMLQYDSLGDPASPVILMLHGWGVSGRNFDSLAGELSTHNRIIVLDLPGFGGSETPPSDWHIEDYAKLVQGFLAKAEIRHLECVIGHSFGGRISIKGVGTGLLKPKKLVLMGSAGVSHSESFRNQLFEAVAKVGKVATSLPGLSLLRDKLRRQLYSAAGSTDYLAAGPLKQVFLNTVNEDLQSDAASITIPTLMIWGAVDIETPLQDGQLLASKIRGSRLLVIDHAGHFVHLDAAKTVQGYIEEFLH